jgi:hypothetical protein
MKGTYEYLDEQEVDVNLMPAGSEITIPKQPVLGGVGGNPYIWIQFLDENGNPVSEEIFIGRCVQGYTFRGTREMVEETEAYATYSVEDCANNPGPFIYFDGGMSMSGMQARLIFRNNDNPVGGPHEADAMLSQNMDVIPAGKAFTFPKQPVLGGVGGNPWIWSNFLDGNSSEISEEVLMGRIVQMCGS